MRERGERGDVMSRDVSRDEKKLNLYTIRNKDAFIKKMNRIEGKLKAIRVMVTRQGTTIKDIHEILDVIEDEMSDLNTMIEREETVYGR